MLAPSVIYCLTQRSRIIYPVYRVAFPASFSSRSWSTRRFIPRPSQDAMIHIRASFLRHARHAGRNARRGFNLSLLHVLRNCATSSINCCSPFLYPFPFSHACCFSVHARTRIVVARACHFTCEIHDRTWKYEGLGKDLTVIEPAVKVSCCSAESNQRYKGAKVILFDSRIPPGKGKKHPSSCGRRFTSETRFSHYHSLLRP